MRNKTIKWIVAPFGSDPNEVTVWVDVAKVDQSWSLARGYHIGPGGTGAAIGGRYARFGAFIPKGVPVWMAALGLQKGGVISFMDGRHRFAWLRDRGVQALPVRVPPEQADIINAVFGTRRRTSRLIPEAITTL